MFSQLDKEYFNAIVRILMHQPRTGPLRVVSRVITPFIYRA